MNRSTCASGSGYVPSDSIGFCVAMTRNGSGTGYVLWPIVTCRSCITSRSADCTFAGARLISSASRKLQKTGPSSVSKSPRSGRHTRVPTRSEGTRSGVNCTRWKRPPSTWARVAMVNVLARPGTPSSSRCPPASSATSTRSSIPSWPTITRLSSNNAASNCTRASAAASWRGVSSIGSSSWSGRGGCSARQPRRAQRPDGGGRGEQRQGGDGEADRHLAPLDAEADPGAEVLVHGIEVAAGRRLEEAAAGGAGDPRQAVLVGRDRLEPQAAEGSLLAQHAAGGAERDRV